MKCLSKILVLFCVVICCSIQGIYAQYFSQYDDVNRILLLNVQDSAYLRITYSLSYLADSLKPKQVWKDRKILLIGDSILHFYSEYQRSKDSVATVAHKKGKAFRPLSFAENISPETYDIYFYTTQGIRMIQEYITELSSYRYKEFIESPIWKLSADTCTILSYTCQKAIAHFRGRDWTVWFTMEVPIDAGPWKLCGLPGLIMKASDSRGHYVFECIGLKNISKKKQPIIKAYLLSPVTDVECTRQEYMTAQRQYYENYFNTLLALGWNLRIIDDSGKQIEFIKTPNTTLEEHKIMYTMPFSSRDKYRKLPYNPIELE
jgi:GLPGLI family protein